MKYQTDNKYRKYVQGYGFLSFARNFKNFSKVLAKKFSKSKYGKALKKRVLNLQKLQENKFLKNLHKQQVI